MIPSLPSRPVLPMRSWSLGLALVTLVAIAAVHPAAAEESLRLPAGVVPQYQEIRLDLDARKQDYSGSVRIDLRVAIRYDVHRRWAVFAEGGVQATGVTFASGVGGDYRALISGFGVAYRPAW